MNLAAANIVTGKTIFGVAGTYPLAAVSRTGQTGCWNASGTPIACAGTGQDGEKLKGVVSPAPRFTDNGNGTVTDNLTGLIWLKNANCWGQINWATALANANSLASGACGLSDGSAAGQWRLPNIKERQSLISFQNISPALPTGHPFINVQTTRYYWSATTSLADSTYVWYVNLNHGFVGYDPKTYTNYVWPVR